MWVEAWCWEEIKILVKLDEIVETRQNEAKRGHCDGIDATTLKTLDASCIASIM